MSGGHGIKVSGAVRPRFGIITVACANMFSAAVTVRPGLAWLPMSMATAYLCVARLSFRRQNAYRLASVAGAFTNSVFAIIMASTMTALFRSRAAEGNGAIDGLSLSGALVVVFVGQGLLRVISMFGWSDLADRVRTGDIAVDLQRPADVSTYWAAVFVGQSVNAIALRGIPPLLVGLALFDLHLPADVGRWAWFIVAVFGAAALASRWWFLVSLISFWVVGDARGWMSLSTTLMLFGTGSLLPLQLIPGSLETVVRHLPFAAMLQFPSEVLLGTWNGAHLLVVQVTWIAALHMLGLFVFGRAQRKLVIDGG